MHTERQSPKAVTHARRYSPRRVMTRSRAGLGFLLLVVAGCASPLGGEPGRPFFSHSSRDIQRAIEKDPFPTASQAGLVPVTPAK